MEREQRHEPQLIEQIQIDPERSSVLAGVIEARGNRDFSKFVISETLSGRKNRVVISGEPGNGKTALMTQLAAEIEENGVRVGKPRRIIKTFYDTYLTGDRSYDDTLRMNQDMIRDIERKEKEEPDAIHLLEIPDVGLYYPKDRGRTAVDFLEEDSVKKDNNTVFVRVLLNNVVQQRAGYLRAYIQDVPDKDILRELERFNVSLIGVDRLSFSGAEIKELFAKMATTEEMRVISSEQRNLEREWAIEKDLDESRVEINDFPIDSEDIYETLREFNLLESNSVAQSLLFVDSNKQIATTQALYYEDRYTHKGIGKNSHAIIFNPYSPRNTVIDLSKIRPSAA